MMLISTILLGSTLIETSTASKVINRLNEAQTQRRQLITIKFSDKMCINFGGRDWLTPLDGDYIYNGMINGKPSYRMQTCRDSHNCKIGATLKYDNNWQLGGLTSCNDNPAPSSPDQCNSWFGNRSPNMGKCGNDKQADNGQSSGSSSGGSTSTEGLSASQSASGCIRNTVLTQSDKDKILNDFNKIRNEYNLSPFRWDYALEQVAKATTNMCKIGHPGYGGKKPEDICRNNGGEWNRCLRSPTQATAGPQLDTYPDYAGYCWIYHPTNPFVAGLMNDGHRDAILDTDNQNVACAFTKCQNGGFIACNYM